MNYSFPGSSLDQKDGCLLLLQAAANTALTVWLDINARNRDQGFSRDIVQLQHEAAKASVDISSLQAKVTGLESSNTQLCNKA